MATDKQNARRLSEEEDLFCSAYVNCWNGTQAYHEAISPDCNHNSAASQASVILRRPEIKARISELVEEKKANFELSGDILLHELMSIAFASVASVLNEEGEVDPLKLAAAPPDLKRALEQVETTSGPYGTKTKVKFHNKLKAIELLGKTRNLKLFVDSTEITDPNKAPMEVQVTFKSPDKPNV